MSKKCGKQVGMIYGIGEGVRCFFGGYVFAMSGKGQTLKRLSGRFSELRLGLVVPNPGQPLGGLPRGWPGFPTNEPSTAKLVM